MQASLRGNGRGPPLPAAAQTSADPELILQFDRPWHFFAKLLGW